MSAVVISRRSAELSDPRGLRVYVTGPHFGTHPDRGIYSSRRTLEEAVADDGTFTDAEARRLIALGKWSNLDPRIEAVPA